MNGKTLREYLSLSTPTAEGCILWAGSIDRDGYGRFSSRLAHRVVFEMHSGAIPVGMTVDHTCFNTACVNVDHLRLLSNLQNCRNRRSRPGLFDESKCINGHDYTEENTYRMPSGCRDCRACIRERVKKYRARRRQALATTP